MVQLVDTHAHLDDEAFEGRLDAVMGRAAEAGVTQVVAVGTTAESSDQVVRLAAGDSRLFAAVGIQPNYVAEAVVGDWERICELAGSAKEVVAIGETGIDHHWDFSPRELQQTFFDQHLQLAAERGLPVIIHMRNSGQAIVDQLRRFAAGGAVAGVMHSFTGDLRLMEQCLELGLHISFAGMVTFKKSHDLRDVARQVPADRLLVETDAPYLSPEPFRGKRPNEPARLVHTAECLAGARNMSLEELAGLTTDNARRLFRLPRR